jgi:glycosyltransferase involved in cell wall biosynthesis
MGIVVGIDASRNRSGGAKGHLVGILRDGDPTSHGISRVHVWSYRALLDSLPERPWLTLHNPPELQRSLARQMWWQHSRLPSEIRHAGCHIMLNTDAGTIGNWQPCVVMSRDMLSYEPGEMSRYGFSKAWLRLLALRYVQARSLRRAAGAIFLTEYASRIIQGFTGPLPNVAVIPHGIGGDFRAAPRNGEWLDGPGGTIRCLYVSNAAMYKHQWSVVRAVGRLRDRGHPVSLVLAGGGSGKAQRWTEEAIAEVDPRGEFIRSMGHVEHRSLPGLLAAADVFVFASSCENMPNTLVEAMSAGLPIACSNRGPMPEVLRDAGEFFDPEDVNSIANALERLIADPKLRVSCAAKAEALARQYSWRRCADETWGFLVKTLQR